LDVKTKEGQELYKLQKQNAMLKLLVGRKIGLNIFYADADDIRVTSGICHVNNGADHCVEKATETKVTVSPIAKWQYVVINNLGNIATREAMGTISERPTDPCFQWSGYNPSKQGYYFNKSERIIGAIYRVSSSNWHIINCGEGGNETGEDSLGSWERVGNVQTVRGSLTQSVACDGTAGAFFTTPKFTFLWPVAFFAEATPNVFYTALVSGSAQFVYSYGMPTATGHDGVYLGRSTSETTRNRRVDFIAIGKWR
jgi:hypothetical protein